MISRSFYQSFVLVNKIQEELYQNMFEKTKESPYRTIDYRSLEHSKQNTIKQLELVFTFYAGKGSKYNYQELQEKSFTDMVGQLFQLANMENSINRKSQKWLSITTLYYTKGRSKPLYFSQFLQLLPGLAKCMFCGQNRYKSPENRQLEEEMATKNLLTLFEKMYHIILQEEIYKRGLRSQQIQEETKEFLLKLKDSLIKLYKVYFQYEVNLKDKEKDYQNRSFECFLEFLKDFDVFPKLVSAAQLFFIYNQVLSQEQHNHLSLLSPSLYTKTAFPKLGEHFTLTRFIEGLILASHVGVSKLKRTQGEELLFSSTGLSQKEALKLLLEYMETMRSVKTKYSKYSRQRFTLIVYQQYSDYISKKEENLASTSLKACTVSSSPEHKKSFFDILHKLNL